jgi:2-polyprenyl-6-methoxyphenol hydroxylase-like FAD-dependent oxidoreductase
MAERYRAGRVVLAGDAAHVHSPAGGQGMNTGIRDAIALAGALACALKDHDSAALDSYSKERRPVAEQVVSLADRLTKIATVSRFLSPLRNLAVRAFAHNPLLPRKLALQLAGLAGEAGVSR